MKLEFQLKDNIKKANIISQSMFSSCMLKVYLSIKIVRLIHSSKYIIILFFSIIFIEIGYAQDNSSGSSGSPFNPLVPESKKISFKSKEKENPYFKKFENKKKKTFFLMQI